jgi:hypothetical protein
VHVRHLNLLNAQLVERAVQWAETLAIQGYVNFRVANATLAFDHFISTYPGALQLVAIQWCACSAHVIVTLNTLRVAVVA